MSRIGGSWYELSVEASKFKQGLAEAEIQAAQSSGNISSHLDDASAATDRMAASAVSLGSVLGTLATVGFSSIVYGIQTYISELERAKKVQEDVEKQTNRALVARSQMAYALAAGESEAFTRARLAAEQKYDDQVRTLQKARVTDKEPYDALLKLRDQELQYIREVEQERVALLQQRAEQVKNLYGQDLARKGAEEAERAATSAMSVEQRINKLYEDRIELAKQIQEQTGYDITAENLRKQALNDRNAQLQDIYQKAEEERLRNAEKMLKEQERILDKNTKIMADAMKEFGKYVEKLEQIQRSWNDGFTGLENAGVKEIKAILEGWGPSIRSL